jgi:hypothetical protein
MGVGLPQGDAGEKNLVFLPLAAETDGRAFH